MVSSKSQTSAFHLEQLRAARERLEAAVAAFIAAERVVNQQDSEPIYVFQEASLRTGLHRVESFTRELQMSVYAARMGEPYTAETRKTRGSKNQK